MSQENLVVPLILGAAYKAMGHAHAASAIESINRLSRNPFLWNSVVRGLSHGSTWPGTAQAYRLLLGALLLGEDDFSAVCDSQCEFCGSDSLFQTILKSILTALDYPKPPASRKQQHSSEELFVISFVKFATDLVFSSDSPYREKLAKLFLIDLRQKKNSLECPISFFPSLFEIFQTIQDPSYFYAKLSHYFPPSKPSIHKRQSFPSPSSFLLLVGAKIIEAVTVESGKNFDAIMQESIKNFVSSLPVSAIHSPLNTSSSLTLMNPSLLASSLIQVIRHSLVTVILPPTEWGCATTPDNSVRIQQLLKSDNPQLERCTQFMEPSAVLSVIRFMLTQPNAIPNLSGNNEGKFNYFIGKINFLNFDIDRSLCIIKSLKTSASPLATPLPSSPVGPRRQGAKLALIVKEVNCKLEHEWKIDWNTKKYTSFFGKNIVNVKGLSCQVHFTVFPDDQGPVIESAKISLGIVEHSCTILNSNFISGMLAQAALDWFAEPLTRLLQSASQSAIEEFLKTENAKFRLETWNQVILKIVPSQVLEEILAALNDHLPRHGVPV